MTQSHLDGQWHVMGQQGVARSRCNQSLQVLSITEITSCRCTRVPVASAGCSLSAWWSRQVADPDGSHDRGARRRARRKDCLSGGDDVEAGGPKQPLAVFGHEFAITVHLALGQDIAAGELTVPARLRYQACDESMCYPPARVETRWTLRIES
jgi:hypothetical protein